MTHQGDNLSKANGVDFQNDFRSNSKAQIESALRNKLNSDSMDEKFSVEEESPQKFNEDTFEVLTVVDDHNESFIGDGKSVPKKRSKRLSSNSSVYDSRKFDVYKKYGYDNR